MLIKTRVSVTLGNKNILGKNIKALKAINQIKYSY